MPEPISIMTLVIVSITAAITGISSIFKGFKSKCGLCEFDNKAGEDGEIQLEFTSQGVLKHAVIPQLDGSNAKI